MFVLWLWHTAVSNLPDSESPCVYSRNSVICFKDGKESFWPELQLVYSTVKCREEQKYNFEKPGEMQLELQENREL